MEYITDVEGLEGKVIKKASLYDVTDAVCFIFTDDSCCCLRIEAYGDCYDINFTKTISEYDKREIGIIDQETYERYCKEEIQRREEAQEGKERMQLLKLKEKYENK